MQVIQRGSSGDDVEKWQIFLRGQDLFDVEVNGKFGPITEEGTKEFQRRHGLTADGIVGNRTWGKAMEIGLDEIEDPASPDDTSGPNWPPVPADLEPIAGNASRQQLFGPMEFEAAPKPGNQEGIRITNNWDRENIIKVAIPQLAGVNGAPFDGRIFIHKKVKEQFLGLFDAWEKEGLIDLVLTWAGSYVPRFIRGSRTVLSNHAFGTAFDINVAWNGLGLRPALKGRKGSVRELVPIANKHGFYWGGQFRKRPDGMHFEVAKIL